MGSRQLVHVVSFAAGGPPAVVGMAVPAGVPVLKVSRLDRDWGGEPWRARLGTPLLTTPGTHRQHQHNDQDQPSVHGARFFCPPFPYCANRCTSRLSPG